MSGNGNDNNEIMEFSSKENYLNETVLDLAGIDQPFMETFYTTIFKNCLFAFEAQDLGDGRLELSKVVGSLLRISGVTGQKPTDMDYSRIQHYTTSNKITENKKNITNRMFNLMIYGIDTGKDNNIESTMTRLGYDR
ncbi:unnamed protein product, partial [Adineta steineri]